jgi:translation initiation factor 3 subunit I
MVVTCNDKMKTQAEGLVPPRIMVWQFREKTGAKKLLCIDNLNVKAFKVKWGPFDETLFSIDEEGSLFIWSAEDGSQLQHIAAHRSFCTSLSFNEDRTLLLTTSKDQTAKLWSTDNFEIIKTYKTDRPLNDAAITPLLDDKENPRYHILLGGGQDAKDVTTTAGSSGKFEACLWNMVFEEEIGQIKGGFGPLNCLAWFRDGRGFVTGGEDGYVRVHHFDADFFMNKRVYD